MQRKTAETADFTAAAPRKSLSHMLQHLFYRVFNRLSVNVIAAASLSINSDLADSSGSLQRKLAAAVRLRVT